MNVSLFISCICEVFYPNVGKDVVELLEKLNCQVDFPSGQTCCGQPAYNSGYRSEAVKAAKSMIKAFEQSEYVVTPSGSCAAMLHEYKNFFHDDPIWKEKAIELSNKTFEFTEFLVDVLKKENVGASLETKATYHPSCHMTRLLGVQEAPMKLLSHVKGLDIIPLPNSHHCCGFGGTFSVKMPRISEQMVDEKVRNVVNTEVEVLIGSDNSCLMNIGGRINRLGKPIKVMHIAEVLNQGN